MTIPTTEALHASTAETIPSPRAPDPLARLAVFLRTELAPAPARWRASLRIVVACLVATTLAMTLRIPHGHWLIITIFIVSQPNVGASIEKAILRLAGTVVGAFGVIVTVVAFPQQPWFAIPLIALLIGASAFLSRTTTMPYVALLGGITIVLFLGSATVHPVASVTDGLWRLAVIALAEVIATATQLLLWPEDPEEHLLSDLERILGIVERRLQRLGDEAGEPLASDAEVARLRDAAFNGLARHLDLLGNAESRYLGLRARHAEQLVLIGAVNRLASASLTLEALLGGEPLRSSDGKGTPPLRVPLRARVRALAQATGAVRRALAERRPVSVADLEGLAAAHPAGPQDLPFIAPLRDMERSLADLPPASRFLDRGATPAASLPGSFLDDGGARHFFTPACTLANRRDLRFAAQVSLAATLCYLIVAGLDWPGISTAVVTCVIVGQSSFGATVQKALLRIAGAVVGGLLGLVALVLVIPSIDSLPPFLLVIGAGTAIAAWVATGSARISYVGIQIAMAFAMTLLDSFGPSVDLATPRDRVIGVLLGNAVIASVLFWVWPVLASREMVASVESALRHMATLSRFGLSGSNLAPLIRPAHGFRLQIYQDIAATLRLHGESQFEPGAAAPERQLEQRRVLRVLQEVQQAFPLVAGLVRNRLNAGLGQVELPSRQDLRAVALAIGPRLEAAADVLGGHGVRPPPDLATAIAAAEATLALDQARSTDVPGAIAAIAEMRTQLELYRTLEPLLDRLDALAAEAAAARAASVAAHA